MRVLFCMLGLCLLLMGCDHIFSNEDGITITPDITIKSVQVGIMNSHTDQPDEYSVFINFNNNGVSIYHWLLGFYMPATSFDTLVNSNQNYNPKLTMEICDSQSNCAQLRYEKASNILESDLSQGYTTILTPMRPFPLLHNKTYMVRLLHNNQWGGGNISYFPQSIFFVLSDQTGMSGELERVHVVPTNLNAYSLASYDQNSIDIAINNHIQTNWINSIPYTRSIQNINLVPSPVQLQIGAIEKKYNIQNGIAIHNQLDNDNQLASRIAEALRVDINVRATIDNQVDKVSGIIIQPLVNKEVINNNPEGYILIITPQYIIIQAINNAGVYYAYQTLRQLWNDKKNKNGAALRQMFIVDYPRFKYRGILLDTARHFFNVAEIKSFIDLMGAHKLNTLHLHLSDDEAFRLDLPSYPTLQSVGATRGFGLSMGPMMFLQGNLYKTYDDIMHVHADTKYSGTYSISDIADIITYANDNQITVIPEIDLPAHTRALIKSLPNAFIDPNDQSHFISAQGYTDDVLPVCTYSSNISIGPIFTRTINNIINIIVSLFNEQTTVYAIKNEISVGGDEVSPNAWTNDCSCQGKWGALSALQKSHKFFQLMALANPNIILSGWQQFVQTDGIELGNTIVPSNRTGHVWVWNTAKFGVPQAITLANNNYPTVLAYADKTYFDLAYTPDIQEPGLNWATQYGDTQAALSSALSASMVIKGTNSLAQVNIVGLEGALWSENLGTYKQMIYMALPKMAGLSEASWSPSIITHNNTQLNWQSLATRLGYGQTGFLAYLNKVHNAHYRGYPNGIKLETPE